MTVGHVCGAKRRKENGRWLWGDWDVEAAKGEWEAAVGRMESWSPLSGLLLEDPRAAENGFGRIVPDPYVAVVADTAPAGTGRQASTLTSRERIDTPGSVVL